MNGLLGRTALPVNRHSRHRFRQLRTHNAGAGNVESLRPDLADAAKNHILNGRWINAGTIEQCINDDATQISGMLAAQTAITTAPGGTNGVDNIGFSHDRSPD